MRKTLIDLFKKHKSFVFYGIFGVLTTLVNILSYNFCYYKCGITNTISNIIAWILAVLFAYFTNKIWVFESKSWKWRLIKKELSAFVGCRLATGVLDLIIMYICVDLLGMHALLMKASSNILVIILNYVFSKLIIFKR